MQLFLTNSGIALRQVLMLYLIALVGVAAERLKFFTEAAARQCTKLLLYVITSCVILRSFLTIPYSPETLKSIAIALFGGVLLHVSGIILSEPMFRNQKKLHTDAILHFAAAYGNCGYMAIPLARAMAGEEGVLFCSVIILTFQVFSFTHGAFVMSGGIPFARERQSQVKFRWKNLVLNAGVLSVIVGLPLFLFRVQVPELLANPLGRLADMQSPLAMLMFGAYLSRTKFQAKTLLQSRKFFYTAFVKLFGIPLVVMTVLLSMGVRGALLNAVLISASAPSANNTVIFAANNDRDAGYAAQIVAVISFVSILTMPFLIALGLSI